MTSAATPKRSAPPRLARLPLRGLLRINPAADMWHKPALSVVVALAIPNLLLLASGRLDLGIYASAGALCALFAHGLPYAARARMLAGIVVGMLTGLAAALVVASVTDSTAVHIVAAGLLAGLQKVVTDAARTGPPGSLIFTFVSSSAVFAPQQLSDVPAHLALAIAGGVLAWLVCMAPALVRPHGPERIAVARALEAAARLCGEPAEAPQHVRHAAAAVHGAWQNLTLVPVRSGSQLARRRALERLLLRAETAVAAEPGSAPGAVPGEQELSAWARALRRGKEVPEVRSDAGERSELVGVDADLAIADPPRGRAAHTWWRRFGALLRPGAPLAPVGARVAVGSVIAGFVSLGAGVGHPYWAIVTVAAVCQTNLRITWTRAVQRAIGTFAGLLIFTAIAPMTRSSQLVLVLAFLTFQFGTEATITRNYWLGSVFVTSMALLITTFTQSQPTGELVVDRWIDTCVGVVVGVLSSMLVTNRRATDRIDEALEKVDRAQGEVRSLTNGDDAGLGRQRSAGKRLVAALVELRDAVNTATGEWWQRALPQERILHAERDGHAALGDLVLYFSPRPRSAGGDATAIRDAGEVGGKTR
ncbi:MAG TPA: FUSC family protein [Pseudonocardiaceae bacterium]|nr:FUSC family protein [Pseudonocardiaceae bacterium]